VEAVEEEEEEVEEDFEKISFKSMEASAQGNSDTCLMQSEGWSIDACLCPASTITSEEKKALLMKRMRRRKGQICTHASPFVLAMLVQDEEEEDDDEAEAEAEEEEVEEELDLGDVFHTKRVSVSWAVSWSCVG